MTRSLLASGLMILGMTIPALAQETIQIEQKAPETSAVEATAIDYTKIEGNLNRIAELVRKKNPELLNSVDLKIGKTDIKVYDVITLNLLVKSQLLNELGLNLEISDTSLGIANVDSATLTGHVDVNGYELVKKLQSKMLDSEKKHNSKATLENVLNKGAVACASIPEINAENFQDKYESYVSCFANYHLMKTKSFSEFLAAIQPYVKQMKKVGNQAYYNELSKTFGGVIARAIYYGLTGNDIKVCTKQTWGCFGKEYLFIRASGNAMATSRLAADITISEQSVKISVSAYAFRMLTESMVGGDYNIRKAEFLKDLENMTDEQITSTAKSTSDLIQGLSTEVRDLMK